MTGPGAGADARGGLSGLLETLVVFLAVFVPLQAVLGAAEMTIFTTRDLDRALRLAEGRLILFGPELSAGGQLPGPFYYFMLAPLLKLGLGWKAAWQLQFAMAAGAFALLWRFARARFGLYPACYALFCAAFFHYMTLFVSNNASFLPLFVAAALAALCAAFAGEPRRAGPAWAVFCLACGLGLQLHLSFGLLLLAGPAVQLLAGPLGLRRLPWKTFLAGLGALALTLLPYFIWKASELLGAPLGQPVLPFTGGGEGELGGILSFAYETRAGRREGAMLYRVVTQFPLEALVPLALAFFVPAGKGRPVAPAAGFARDCVKVLAAASLLTLALYAMTFALSPSRYALIPRLCLDLLACAALAARADRFDPRVLYPALVLSVGGLFFFLRVRHRLSPDLLSDPLQFWFPAAAGAALFFLLRRREGGGAALFSLAPFLPLLVAVSLNATMTRQARHPVPGAADLEAMSRLVVAQTGWSYEEARLRLFYVNLRDKVTPSWIYRAVPRGSASPDASGSGLDRVDGYFAALFWETIPYPDSPALSGRWLMDQDIPGLLREGLKSRGILLGTPAPCGRLLVIPYKVADTQRFPPRFHNGSEGYSLTAPEPPPRARPGETAHRFTFNDCPGGKDICDIHADVRIRGLKGARRSAAVTLSGEPLSQVCYGVNMQWTERLIKPYFYAVCGGKERRTRLAGFVGMERDEFRSSNRSLPGPYVRVFEFDCPGRLEKFAVGYEASSSYTLDKIMDGPAREISVPGGGYAPAAR